MPRPRVPLTTGIFWASRDMAGAYGRQSQRLSRHAGSLQVEEGAARWYEGERYGGNRQTGPVYHRHASTITLPRRCQRGKIGIMDGVANMLAGATQPLAAVISTYVHSLRRAAMQCRGHDLQTKCPSAAFATGSFCTAWISDPGAAADPCTGRIASGLALGEMSSARCPAHRGVRHRWECRRGSAAPHCAVTCVGFISRSVWPGGSRCRQRQDAWTRSDPETRMALGSQLPIPGGLTANTAPW